MHVLVDAALAGGEPVVDGAELDEHPALDAGLLGHLARGGLGQRLLALDVPLGQAPLDAAGPVAAGDDGDAGLTLVDVDDHPARAALLDRREPPGRHPGRVCGDVAHLVTVTSVPPRGRWRAVGELAVRPAATARPGGARAAYPWCSCPPVSHRPPCCARRSPTWRPTCRCSPTSASGSRPPGTTWPSSAGPVRDALLGRAVDRPGLHDLGPPRRHRGACSRPGARRRGTWAASSARSAPGGAAPSSR